MRSAKDELSVAERVIIGACITIVNAVLALLERKPRNRRSVTKTRATASPRPR